MNKMKKEGQCYFTLESKIGGVVEQGIVVNGWFYSENDDESEDNCLLLITVDQYKKYAENWLKEKLDYCNRYNEFCGENGNAIINGEFDMIDIFGYEVFDCRFIEIDDVDMEHG
jgi:hypothetical protein